MLISEKIKTKQPTISFEIFPPKQGYPVDTIYETIDGLSDLNPDFISVTYGAGGSTKGTTVEISSLIQQKHNIPALAHLTCLTSTRDEIDGILDRLSENGVRNILALRGDLPQNSSIVDFSDNNYSYSSDLIKHIKERGDFCIGGACYPETHKESKNAWDDIVHLREKVDQGLDFLITQLFFDNELFYSFVEKAESMGVDVPIIPGIMPIMNISQVSKIVSLTGCSVPRKFLRIIEKYEHNPAALKEAGIAYAASQIIDLIAWGVPGVHVYSMNKAEETRRIVNSISTIRGCHNR